MASVEKRGDSYRIVVSGGYDISGKQIKQQFTWKPKPGMSQKQIEKELERQKVLFEEKVKNEHFVTSSVKFETLAKEWLEQAELEGHLKVLTLKRLKQCQARTYQAIGHLPIGKISTMQIQKFINNLAEDGINLHTGGGLSSKTQKLYLNFISDVMNFAIRCNMISRNPCHGVQVIATKKKEREMYTVEEAQEFLNHLQNAPIKYRTFFILAIFSGFRRGELLGLEWKDIDFENCVITIRRTSLYAKEKGIFEGTPKTEGSYRCLKLPTKVMEALREYKQAQDEDIRKLGDRWHDTDRLFTTWDGHPMGPDSVRHWLEKFCKREGLRYVNVHSFRHLNASMLIQNGVDVRTVSAALGHSQTSTTLNIYAHAFDEAQAKASEAIADTLNLD